MKKICRCDTRLHFFSRRVINRRNSLSQEDIDSASIDSFKNRLEKRRPRQGDFFSQRRLVYKFYPAARWCDKLHVGLDRISIGQVQPRQINSRGPIYKISYDLAYDHRKFIVRSTYDSHLKRAEISLRNIVS